MSLLSRLLSPRTDPHSAIRPLWHRIVALARDPEWYRQGGVVDTVSGRFDAITLVLALVLLRMGGEAMAAPAVLLTELFITDMDGQLRESGVGDLMVGKQVGRLMGVLGGRLGAYGEALGASGEAQGAGDAALAAAVSRNVGLRPGADPAVVAGMARALSERLAALPDAVLLAGEIA